MKGQLIEILSNYGDICELKFDFGWTKSVILPGYNGKVEYSLSGNKLILTPPVITPANNSCRYAWVFKIYDFLNSGKIVKLIGVSFLRLTDSIES